MMEFLKDYKYKQLDDGCVVLELVPVELYPEISVCVNPNSEYVAIFDADFQPEPDFLWRTIPFLLSNHDLALVQARWKFGEFRVVHYYLY